MDILQIISQGSKELAAAIIKKVIRKKYGINVDIRFTDDFKLKLEDGAHLSFAAKVDISKDELASIRKKYIGF